MNKEAIGTLTGKFFHSVMAAQETIKWQGKFLGLASPGLYRVQLFEWWTGAESDQLLVPATDMRYWRVYDTEEQWRAAYDKYAKTRGLVSRHQEAENEEAARLRVLRVRGEVKS